MDDTLNLEDGGDLPPPYSASVNPSSAVPVQHSDPRSYSSLFSFHVAGLRSQISASQAARASARDDRDSSVLSIIVPYMEDFFSSISEIHPTPRLAEATLIPDAAVSEDWKFNDEDEKRAGEYRKLIRVCVARKKDGDRKKDQWPSEKGSDSNTLNDENDGTGPSLWWESESTARRLAKHLQPQRPTSTGDAPLASNKKSGFWGLFKKSEDVIPRGAPTAKGPGDGVTMTARAEEITFRKENELGIWETKTGWGIVVRVRIQST